MKLALGLEYLGTHYKGWQRQPDFLTVQECVENAISSVANETVATICAGRTDSGVHASAQVVHFETKAIRRESAWILGVNRYLPSDISVKWVREMPTHFSARYSALSRRYRYIIDNSRTRPGIESGRVAWYNMPLDAEIMHQAAQQLLGEHDFTSFRGSACQSKTPVRSIYSCSILRKQHRVEIEIEANAFLHHMVRNIVGTLLQVGAKDHPPEWVAEVLASRNRVNAGEMAKAEGLYLIHVNYPREFGI